jgi:hypothetical protein
MDTLGKTEPKADPPRGKAILHRLLYVLVGPPIAWLVGSIGGLVVGVAAAWTLSRDQDEFIAIRDNVALYSGIACAVIVLFLALGGDRLLYAVRDRVDPEWLQDAWLRINIAAAVVLGLAAFFVFHFYTRFVSNGELAAALFLVGLPLAVFGTVHYVNGDRQILGTWLAFAAAVLFQVGARAIPDSNELRYHECWMFRDSGTTSMWECAPGRGGPRQWFNVGRTAAVPATVKSSTRRRVAGRYGVARPTSSSAADLRGAPRCLVGPEHASSRDRDTRELELGQSRRQRRRLQARCPGELVGARRAIAKAAQYLIGDLGELDRRGRGR